MNPEAANILETSLEALRTNEYPGRGLICGLSEDGESAIQIYWIMGRSPNSQNRVFDHEKGRLFTKAADPSKVEDPSLIIYDAMNSSWSEEGGASYHVVSNGKQTNDVLYELNEGHSLDTSLEGWSFEPDEPNFTPRITGVCEINPGAMVSFGIELAIIRRSPFIEGEILMQYYPCDGVIPGVGFCLTTYTGNGDPLPSFDREPIPMQLKGDRMTLLDTYWEALNPNFRISLAVKTISLASGKCRLAIRNRFQEVSRS